MTTLTDFLLARIAEDEAVARAATEGPWRSGDTHVLADGSVPTVVCDTGPMGALNARRVMADARHIARHDPARVLAECEAHRRIVERNALHLDAGGGYDEDADLARYTLRALALPYADHPGFRAEWAL